MSMFQFIRFSLAALLIGFFVAACSITPINSTPAAPTQTPIGPDVTIGTLQAAPTVTPPPNGPITLTLWVPPSFTPGDASPAQKILAQQLQAIDPHIQIITKKEHGAGGLLDLLTAASPIAPAVLPDIIALDTTDLATAARSGLLQPIDALLPADLAADLYPFAHDLGSIDGKMYGIVYSADFEHLAINTTVIKTAPAKWSDLTQRYIFSVHDEVRGVSDAVLSQYFAAGGTLVNANQQPALDQDTLTQLLGLYQQAQHNNVLASNTLDLTNDAEAGAVFLSSNSGAGNVSASLYMSVAQSLPDLKFAALPTIDQPAPPIARGWTLAIVTREPRRQITALKFIDAWLSPEYSGVWTQAANVLPGRVSALQQWDQKNPYTAFISDQLQRATAAPSAAIMNVVGPALRKAIDDVLAGRATPIDAAQAAVTAVNQIK